MAGARIERVGSIFKRVDGLYKGGVFTKDELPLWYDICKRFPPHREPDLSRPAPTSSVKSLTYVEDYIRGHFMKTYQPQTRDHVSLLNPQSISNSLMDKYVMRFMKAAKKDDGKSPTEIISHVEESLAVEGYQLTKKTKKK